MENVMSKTKCSLNTKMARPISSVFNNKSDIIVQQTSLDQDYEDIGQILSRLKVSEHQNLLLVPTVYITCSCSFGNNASFNHASKNTESVKASDESNVGVRSVSSSSDSDGDNDDSFKLAHLFRAFTLYENKTTDKQRASRGALRNLINSYHAYEDIGEDETKKVIGLLEHEDFGLREMALLTIQQLCVRENNAFKFLFHDIVSKLLLLLELETTGMLHEPAAFALEQVLIHVSLKEWWEEQMKMGGFSSIINHLSAENSLPVRYACACVLRSLVQVKLFANYTIEHTMDVIGEFRNMNSDFQEVYTEIMSRLLLHADDLSTSVLNIDALPASVNMLSTGPCGPQQHSLLFIATLAESNTGLHSILENKVVPLLMSALVNTDCRKVRESAASAIAHITANESPEIQKQILLQVDEFYFEQSDKLEALVTGEAAGDNNSGEGSNIQVKSIGNREKMCRAVEHLSRDLIRLLQKEGKMEKDLQGDIVNIHMAPGIDVNSINLNTICELLTIIRHLICFNVYQVKVQLSAKLEELHPKLIKQVRRKKLPVNHNILKVLVNSNLLSIIDLLSVYTQKLLDVISFHDKSKSADVTANEMLFQAWDIQSTVMSKTGTLYLRSIFDEFEIKVIKNLIETIVMITKCSASDRDPLEEKTNESLESKIIEKIHRKETDALHLSRSSGKQQGKSQKKIANKNKQAYRYHSKTACELCRNNILSCSDSKANGTSQKVESTRNPGSVVVSKKQATTAMLHCIECRSLQCGMSVCDCSNADALKQIEKAHTESLRSELGILCRNLRMVLFENGAIESIGPWLLAADNLIGEMVLSMIKNMIQPLNEKIMLSPPQVKTPLGRRPVSEMSSKERDHAMNIALYQMSTRMRQFIKDALGDVAPQNTPREAHKATEQSQMYIPHNYEEFARSSPQPTTPLGSRPPSGKIMQVPTTVNSKSAEESTVPKNRSENGFYSSQARTTTNLRNAKRPSSASAVRKVTSSDGTIHRQTITAKQRRPRSCRPTSAKMTPLFKKVRNDYHTHTYSSYMKTNENGTSTTTCDLSSLDTHSLASGSSLTASASNIGYDSGISSSSRSRFSEGGHRCRSPPRSAKMRSSTSYTPGERSNSVMATTNSRKVWIPWKPQLDQCQPIAEQCRSLVAMVVGKVLLKQLFGKDLENRKKVLNFIDEYIKHGQVGSHLKMSEFGIVPKMVDFLRVNDDDELLEMMGLSVVQGLVKSDVRLKDLFHKHGGTQLLMAMTSSSSAILKEEVAQTLKVVSKDTSSKIATRKRINSAPQRKMELDVWDNIMDRWKKEDKVTDVLQKFT